MASLFLCHPPSSVKENGTKGQQVQSQVGHDLISEDVLALQTANCRTTTSLRDFVERQLWGVTGVNRIHRTASWFACVLAPDAGWVGDGYDGVHIFAPNGDRIGLIRLPEICSNVCFGGTKRNRLFMTGSTSLYAVYVEAQGAHIS